MGHIWAQFKLLSVVFEPLSTIVRSILHPFLHIHNDLTLGSWILQRYAWLNMVHSPIYNTDHSRYLGKPSEHAVDKRKTPLIKYLYHIYHIYKRSETEGTLLWHIVTLSNRFEDNRFIVEGGRDRIVHMMGEKHGDVQTILSSNTDYYT